MVNTAGAVFRVRGAPPEANYITLTTIGSTPPRWRFTLSPLAALDMVYVNLDWSEASPELDIPENVEATANCIGWLRTMLVVSSRTEDRSGNGKIDRIRVRAAQNLNYNFADLEVQVEGYELASPDPYVGPDAGLGADEFWILLVEKPYLDTAATPRWRITLPVKHSQK